MTSKQTLYLNQLSDIRERIRSGDFQATTSGLMPNLVQGNLLILQQQWADELVEYCNNNPKPCPIIGVSQPGDPSLPALGEGIDIRVDVPQYHVYRDGKFESSSNDITRFWRDDSVAIILGCSFSFEHALQAEGLAVRNIDMGTNVSMFDTNIATQPTEHFCCNMVVTMRPFKQDQIEDVKRITSQFPKAHGGPIHVGDPNKIGIHDLGAPQYGSPVGLEKDDIPVFWACGVTTQKAVTNAKLPTVITHAPGKMLITDKLYE